MFQRNNRIWRKGLICKSPSVARLLNLYNKPGDIKKEFWEKATNLHSTFNGLKITNWIITISPLHI